MKLPVEVDSLENIPEELHENYFQRESDGKFVLDAWEKDMNAQKERLKEFRENNIKLTKRQEQLEASLRKFEGIDPEKALAAQKKLEEIDEKALISEGKVDELLNNRVSKMKENYERRIEGLSKKNEETEKHKDRYKKLYEEGILSDRIIKGVKKVAKLRDGSEVDILNRARAVWQLNEEGNLNAKDSTGEQLFGKNGREPLTIAEWAMELKEKSSYLFEDSVGGGAVGSGNSTNSGGKGKRILSGDPVEFGKNLEDIASGKVQVQ